MYFKLGLIGYPLGHSFSPKIHAVALDSCGLNGEYSLFPIAPTDLQGLEELLGHVRNNEITGLNVTIPHKQNVIPLLDELTLRAETIGAVNTIFLRDSKLIGDNTDAPGFLADLNWFLEEQKSHVVNHQSSIKNRKLVLVLGAGGSARAVVYALIQDCWQVTVTSRRIEQSHALVAQLSNSNSHLSTIAYHPTNLYSLFSNLSLIVNTTPLGMLPDIDSSPWPADLSFPPNTVIYDLVYNPCETKLVKDARLSGLSATTGLGMLIEQAALSFEIWTGCNPSREALEAAVN